MGAALQISAAKTSIVSINHAKVNLSYLSGLEQSFWSCTCEHHQDKERDSQERGKESVFSFRGQWGLALIARRNVCDSSHTFARRKAGDSSTAFAPVVGDVWRGYLRESSPFTSFSLTFGKLTSGLFCFYADFTIAILLIVFGIPSTKTPWSQRFIVVIRVFLYSDIFLLWYIGRL